MTLRHTVLNVLYQIRMEQICEKIRFAISGLIDRIQGLLKSWARLNAYRALLLSLDRQKNIQDS